MPCIWACNVPSRNIKTACIEYGRIDAFGPGGRFAERHDCGCQSGADTGRGSRGNELVGHGRQGRLDHDCAGRDVAHRILHPLRAQLHHPQGRKEDPLFMDKIKDYILVGEIKAAIAYCRSVNTPSARMIEKGITRLGRPVKRCAGCHRERGKYRGGEAGERPYHHGHHCRRRADAGISWYGGQVW